MSDDIEDYFKYIYKLTVDNIDIYITVTVSGQVRAGSKHQLQNAHMPPFPSWKSIPNSWLELWIPENQGHTLIHLAIKDGAIWCNIGKDLTPGNKEFPYLFMTKLRYLSIEKKAQEIENKHDDHLRQQRLLHGIDLNR